MNKGSDIEFDPDAIPFDEDGDVSPWTLDELDDAADLGSLRRALSGADARVD